MGNLLSEEQSEQLNLLSNVHIYESSFAVDWKYSNEEKFRKAKQWVDFLYEEIQPEIIHFNNFAQASGSWKCPVVTAYHFCVLTWWLSVKGTLPPFQCSKYLKTLKAAITVSDVVVAPSKSILKQAEIANGTFSRSQVINYGLEVTRKYDVDKEDIILSAGCFSNEAKNIRLLAEIAKNLDWPVCIAGNNTISDASTLISTKNVFLLGILSKLKLKSYMDRASIFVMPAKYQPFGLVLLEAAQSNCALVLAKIPSLQEIWGDAALYFDPEDGDQAETAILTLIKDERLRKEMAQKAYARSQQFTAEKMADEYYQLYESLHVPVIQKLS
jgi:glycosyltransferase involved in cell wall biosynthesis